MLPASSDSHHIDDPTILLLASFLESHTGEIVARAERAWESSILLFSQLTQSQLEHIRRLARESVLVLALRLRQDPAYARRVHELGREWGEQAAQWQLHVYSFTKALDLLGYALWDFVAENESMRRLSPATVFLLGKSRDQVLDDLQVPLLSVYLQKREVELEQTQFSMQESLSLPGRSLLLELGNRLKANQDRVIPAWIESVRRIPESTAAMEGLLQRRGDALVGLLLSLLQSPTPETGAASLSSVRNIGLESAQAGLSFQEMFHALQQLRPILWETVYEIYRREQYWHPAEFIEALARLHLLLDLFSEGIGQAYLQQKEMIIQQQSEEMRRRDLKLARGILEDLLPKPNMFTSIPYTDVGAVWMPSQEIGGDFYDILPLPDGDFLIIIGDVSGKGISAALLVSMVKYVLKANAPWHKSPAKLLMEANNFYIQDMGPELFVTLFAARYSPESGEIVYTSAGHDPCFLCHANEGNRIEQLSSQGPLLGVFPEIELYDRRVKLSPGDVLMLYTDGLVNVRCQKSRELDPSGICNFLRTNSLLPADRLARRIIEDTIAKCEPTDDITVVLMKREEGASRHAG